MKRTYLVLILVCDLLKTDLLRPVPRNRILSLGPQRRWDSRFLADRGRTSGASRVPDGRHRHRRERPRIHQVSSDVTSNTREFCNKTVG